jgi:hypothetical protein
MTLDEIFEIREPAAFQSAFTAWSNDRWKRFGYARLSPGERRVIRVNAFIMEDNGNGFDGFLYNSAGDWAHEIYEALVVIGAKRTAKLLDQVIGLFPRGRVPRDTAKRRKLLLDGQYSEKHDQLLNRLDIAFYERDDGLPAKIWLYIQKNKNHFETPPGRRSKRQPG